MARHTFGPVNHRESPTQMTMSGWVDDSGDYHIDFDCGFSSSDKYKSWFNYTWQIFAGKDKDSASLVIDIPAYTIGNGPYKTNCDGKLGTSDDHFYAWAKCGCPGCIDNNPGLTIADIALTKYTAPSWASLSVISTTTKSITVKGTWNDSSNGKSTNDADAKISLYDGSAKVGDITSRSSDGSDPATFDNLTHNKTYTIKAVLSDGVGGDIPHDDISGTTKVLGCGYSNQQTHQFSISADFYATVDGNSSYDQGGIKKSDCKIYDAAGNELSKPITFSTTEGSKFNDNRATASGLTSYTTYQLKYYVTDGHNVVDNTAAFTTAFPYARIRTNDDHKAIPYIYTGGSWHMVKGYVCTKRDGTLVFKEFNGE